MRLLRRAAGAALFLFIAIGSVRAQLSVDDMRVMSPSVEELQPASITALTGLTTLDGDPFWRVDLRPEFHFGRLGIGLKAVLLIGEVDPNDGSGGETKLLTEDGEKWDSFGAFARSVRYVQWAQPRSPFYARYGELFDVRMGHGLLMESYTNFDRRGIRLRVNRDVWGFGTMVNNIDNPELFAQRVYVRPIRAMGNETPFVNRLIIGATMIFDVDPVPVVTDTAFPADYGTDEDALSAFSLDASIPIISNDALYVEVYDELASVTYPNPVAGGESDRVKGNATGVGLEVSKLRAKLEYRVFDRGFEPGLFGYDYEYRARTAPLGILHDASDTAPTKGWFGSATLNLIDGVHISGMFEDYDGDGPNADPRLGLRLIETDLIDQIDVRGFYIKRGITSSDKESFLEDLVDLDEKSLFVMEIAYNVSGPLYVQVTREFRFRELPEEEGEGFETVQKTTAQLGLAF